MIPNDPFILLSYVNTKLRDEYSSLEKLCYNEEIDRKTLVDKLARIGYVYNPATNQFS